MLLSEEEYAQQQQYNMETNFLRGSGQQYHQQDKDAYKQEENDSSGTNF